jgi:hypothetical protein
MSKKVIELEEKLKDQRLMYFPRGKVRFGYLDDGTHVIYRDRNGGAA